MDTESSTRSGGSEDRARAGSLTRQDWINAAHDVLISEGIERVKVEPLATRLNVSRGSFYWHFKSRQDLLDALVERWQETALEPMRAAASDPQLGPVERYEKFMRVWVQGEPYCPNFDLAIRRWALVDEKVQEIVRATDKSRIKMLTGIFREMGYDRDEALVRARIAYYHQIGYYTINEQDPPNKRKQYWPLYLKILTGQ